MLYAVVAAVILAALAQSWARSVGKRAIVQRVDADGKIADARLTEKTRGEMLWEEWRSVVYFVAGVIAGAVFGGW